jgi:hypothetical protein
MNVRTGSALLLCLAASVSAGCEGGSSDDAFARVDRMRSELNGSCNYSISEKNRNNEELLCVLNTLRSRCNKLDDCYIYCLGNDVGEEIGGGCHHLCNYGSKEHWAFPKEAKACIKT